MSLGETIRKMAASTEEAGGPAAFLYGQVVEPEPLRVMVDSRFELSAAFLVVPQHIAAAGLAAGDGLVLLRNRGGGEYLVLGKVGDVNGADP